MTEKLSFYHKKGGNAPRPIQLPGDYAYMFTISAHTLREITRKDGTTSEILSVTYHAVAPTGETPENYQRAFKTVKIDYWTDEESLYKFEDTLQRGFGIALADHADYEEALNHAVKSGAACEGKLSYKPQKNNPERFNPSILFTLPPKTNAAAA